MTRFAMCAGSLIGLAGSSALGAVSITFDDPTSGPEFIHTAPGAPGGVGDLSFRNDVAVDLGLVGTGDAAFLGVQNVSAVLVTEFEVGAITSAPGAPITQATIGGSFRWLDSVSSEVILEGEFVEAAIISFGLVGSIITTSGISGGELAYTPGQPLIDLGVTQLIDPQDAVWTLTDVDFLNGTSVLDFGSERFFNSFDANSAFTGTAFVPTPGVGGLALIVGVAGLRRRR